MKKTSNMPAKATNMPKVYGPKGDMKGVKTSGVKVRGVGAAVKGTMARGPMA
tara:strand:+ start:12920 stop:13075 length:156 start_codon:yes stop_codon:yes gene_type:complete